MRKRELTDKDLEYIGRFELIAAYRWLRDVQMRAHVILSIIAGMALAYWTVGIYHLAKAWLPH